MGLDMYLLAERTFPADSETGTLIRKLCAGEIADEVSPGVTEYYLWGSEWADESARQCTAGVTGAAGLAGLRTPDGPSASVIVTGDAVTVRVDAVYWRKANSIHAWFVDNVQDGVDECQYSDPINYEQLAHLASICERAASDCREGGTSLAGKLLPTRSGFFFGGTDIDDWWVEEVERTARELRAAIEVALEIGGVTFRYHSSW